MKKNLILISAISILSCSSRDDEAKAFIEDQANKNASKTIGNPTLNEETVDATIYFKPLNISCSGGGIPTTTIPGLPYGIPTTNPRRKIVITAEHNSPLQGNLIDTFPKSLPSLIVQYIKNQGITIEQEPIFEEIASSDSYFNNLNYREFTFSDGKTTNQQPDYFGFPQYSFMNRDLASNVIQNTYDKIINTQAIQNNQIKAIRIYYSQYLCNIDQGPSKDLKIQVIY